jgi:hypothetical protein
MTRQIAAAIRLFRPRVLVVGPAGVGPYGPRAEKRLVAAFARKAAKLAADASERTLAAAGLEPHAVDRVCTGLEQNEKYAPYWQKSAPPPRGSYAVLLDAAAVSAVRAATLEMLTQQAVWRLPGTGVLDRPARWTAYTFDRGPERGALLTTGLTQHNYRTDGNAAEFRDIATAANLRLAAATNSLPTEVGRLAATARSDEAPLQLATLAADRILLTWIKLLQQGKYLSAEQARDMFLEVGSGHPLFARANVLALATGCSAEYAAQARARSAQWSRPDKKLAAGAQAFARWDTWSQTPSGRILQAHAMRTVGKYTSASNAVAELRGPGYSTAWQRLAKRESVLAQGRSVPEEKGMTHLAAPLVHERGKIDGALSERCWQTAPSAPLRTHGQDADKPPQTGLKATAQVARTAGALLLALRLPDARGRKWTVDVLLDADRDCWTQLAVRFDTQGHHRAELLLRNGPAMGVRSDTYAIQARSSDRDVTVEVAIPLVRVGLKPRAASVSLLQVQAHWRDPAGSGRLYLQPQPDRENRPERYGVLSLPAYEAPQGPRSAADRGAGR